MNDQNQKWLIRIVGIPAIILAMFIRTAGADQSGAVLESGTVFAPNNNVLIAMALIMALVAATFVQSAENEQHH